MTPTQQAFLTGALFALLPFGINWLRVQASRWVEKSKQVPERDDPTRDWFVG